MRFMMMVKASPESEQGALPDETLLRPMMKYNEELAKAGVLLDLNGLHPSSRGVRIKISGGERSVLDGPFAEPNELIAGYWVIKVKSKEEAIAWAKRVPALHGAGKEAEIELRQVFEPEDFGPDRAAACAREIGNTIASTQR